MIVKKYNNPLRALALHSGVDKLEVDTGHERGELAVNHCNIEGYDAYAYWDPSYMRAILS